MKIKSSSKAFEIAVETLNEGQRRAVEQIEGPVLVVAGPGTGKTQILSARIGQILQSTDAKAHNILALTYTDAGVVAMRKRLIKFIGPTAHNVHIHTFHSFCNKVIQENIDLFGGYTNLQLMSDLDKVDIIRSIIDEFPDDHRLKRLTGDVYFDKIRLDHLYQTMKKENWSPSYIEAKSLDYIREMKDDEKYIAKRSVKTKAKTYAKGDFRDDKYTEDSENVLRFIDAAKTYDQYIQKSNEQNRFDYADMILWVLEAFQKNGNLLLRYQEQYQYFLVDEYQDTNGSQNQLLDLLISFWERPNVFVVGDDDQSIYKFQGANMDNIIEFNSKYEPTLIVLRDNYRSTQSILDLSNILIEKNRQRLVVAIDKLEKKLISRMHYEEIKPDIIAYYNTIHEEADIFHQIKQMHEAGADLSEVAIIYRNHKHIAELLSAFEAAGIPVNTKRRINVLEVPLANQLLNIMTYLYLEQKKPGQGAYLLAEILHYNFFGLAASEVGNLSLAAYLHREKYGNESMRIIMKDAEIMHQNRISGYDKIIEIDDKLTFLTNQISNVTLQTFFQYVLNKCGVMDHSFRSGKQAWNLQVIGTIFDFIKNETSKNPLLTLSGFLDMIEKMKHHGIQLPSAKVSFSERGVHLLTAHSAKGLEFDRVFMINATDKWEKKTSRNQQFSFPPNLVPSNSEYDVEDERRLFYVGMTRARTRLQISYGQKDLNEKEMTPSRFIAELEENGDLTVEERAIENQDIVDYYLQFLSPPQNKSALIDHDMIDQRLENFSMSVTALNKYLACPVTFYFENILRVPSARSVHMGFGSAVHFGLEHFFRQRENNTDKTFPVDAELLRYFEMGMQKYQSHFTEKEYKDRLTFGKKVLLGYANYHKPHWEQVDKNILEYDIAEAHWEGVPISGKIDKIEISGKQVTVVDYKTGKPENGIKKVAGPSEKEPSGLDYWRQIVFYQMLLIADYKQNWQMTTGVMDFIQPNRRQAFVSKKIYVATEDIEMVSTQLKQSYDSIMKHEFEVGCNKPECRWCRVVREDDK